MNQTIQPPAIGKRSFFTASMNGTPVQVTGFPCLIPGFPDIAFFIHRLTDDHWSVNEVTTGCNVHGGPTKIEAMRRATELLHMMGLEKVEALVAGAPRISGGLF